MDVYLDFPTGLKERLWGHLLQDSVEEVAIVFAQVIADDSAVVFSATEHYLAGPDDFVIHSEFHVELTDDARARILKQAWDTGTTPVEFHSHPSDFRSASFSWSDLRGFTDFVPHCRWRLRGRPYLALVVSPGGMDALAWIDATNQPVGLKAIREAGRAVLVPTNRTLLDLERICTEAPAHGP